MAGVLVNQSARPGHPLHTDLKKRSFFNEVLNPVPSIRAASHKHNFCTDNQPTHNCLTLPEITISVWQSCQLPCLISWQSGLTGCSKKRCVAFAGHKKTQTFVIAPLKASQKKICEVVNGNPHTKKTKKSEFVWAMSAA